MSMRSHALTLFFVLCALGIKAQKLLIMDKDNGNQIVNGTTISKYSSDLSTPFINAYFTLKNNSDKPLVVFLKKKVNQIADSTTDFYCFYIKCWPGVDSTDLADTIQPGVVDENFATHVCHIRRVDAPPLVPGFSSITYTLYDRTTFYPQVYEETVTVNYLLSGLGINEVKNQKIEVFPNPANTTIAIKSIDETTFGNCRISIFNSLGKLTLEINHNTDNQNITFPVTELTNGMYFGIITSDSIKPKLFRFIVQH